MHTFSTSASFSVKTAFTVTMSDSGAKGVPFATTVADKSELKRLFDTSERRTAQTKSTIYWPETRTLFVSIY
jgi:hypothetical protein